MGAISGGIKAADLPTGLNGNGVTASVSPDGKSMTVQQSSAYTKNYWNSFDIARPNTVTFTYSQPNTPFVSLNQVTGSSQSLINGALNATNGQVILVNPNGITFGSGSVVNAGGFIASTLGINNFSNLSANKFTQIDNSTPGNITNNGMIVANQGSTGYVALVAPQIINNGTISAMGGPMNTVALASGNDVTLTFKNNMLMGITIDTPAMNSLIQNFGVISVNNGSAMVMSTSAMNAAFRSVINDGMPTVDDMSNNAGTIVLQAKNIINGPGGSITADAFSGKYITNQYHADHDDDGHHHHHHHNGPQISGVAVGGKVDITSEDGLINLGRISANATAVGVNTGTRDAGVGIDRSGTQIAGVAKGGKVDIKTKDGGVINTGKISANATAVGVNTGARDAGVGIDRSGTQIAGVASGGKVDITTNRGGVINTGKITANAVSGGVNTGARDAGVGIDRSGTQIAGVAKGGKVDITTNGGGLINTGKITANADAGGVNTGASDIGLGIDRSGAQVAGIAKGGAVDINTSGGVINVGTISANATTVGVDTGAQDTGIGGDRSGSQVGGVALGGTVEIKTKDGGVINAGKITADAAAGAANTGPRDIGIGVDTSGAQVAGVAKGGKVDITTNGGGVINAGRISANAAAGGVNTGPRDTGIGVNISGAQVAGVAAGGTVGITTNGGGVINAGKITADAAAGGVNTDPRDKGIGIDIAGPQVAGVAAGGNISVTANNGEILNAGKISANAVGSTSKGGSIDLTGQDIRLSSNSSVSAVGETSGGSIFFQYADPVRFNKESKTPKSWDSNATVVTDPSGKLSYTQSEYGNDIWVVGQLKPSANDNYQIGTVLIKSPIGQSRLKPSTLVPSDVVPSTPVPTDVTPAPTKLTASRRIDDGGLSCILFISRDGTLNNECEARNR